MITLQRASAPKHMIRHREVDRSSPEGPGCNFLDADLNDALWKIQDRPKHLAKRHCAADGRVPLDDFSASLTPISCGLVSLGAGSIVHYDKSPTAMTGLGQKRRLRPGQSSLELPLRSDNRT